MHRSFDFRLEWHEIHRNLFTTIELYFGTFDFKSFRILEEISNFFPQIFHSILFWNSPKSVCASVYAGLYANDVTEWNAHTLTHAHLFSTTSILNDIMQNEN